MKEKEKTQIHCQPGSPGGSHDENGDETEGEALETAREARRAADKRVEKLLSGNSAAYVADSVQHGGQ